MHDDPLKDLLRFKDRNSGRDYWYWKDKPEGEAGAALEVLTTHGFSVEKLQTTAEDPPDCEAFIDGQFCGIEVTELVHQKALELSLERDGKERHFVWTRDDFEKEVRARTARKDKTSAVKGGSYQRYILVIVTDEMFLDCATVQSFITGLTFETRLITDILFAISYDPSVQKCPVFTLPVHRRS